MAMVINASDSILWGTTDPASLAEQRERLRELNEITGGLTIEDIYLLSGETLAWLRQKCMLAGFSVRGILRTHPLFQSKHDSAFNRRLGAKGQERAGRQVSATVALQEFLESQGKRADTTAINRGRGLYPRATRARLRRAMLQEQETA